MRIAGLANIINQSLNSVLSMSAKNIKEATGSEIRTGDLVKLNYNASGKISTAELAARMIDKVSIYTWA